MRRTAAIIVLIGFLLTGSLGAVAPLTLCTDQNGEVRLEVSPGTCCGEAASEMETILPAPDTTAMAAPNTDCCIDLTVSSQPQHAVVRPVSKNSQSHCLFIPIIASIQSAPCSELTRVPLDRSACAPPGSPLAGIIVLRC